MADDSTFGGGLALSTGGGQGDASADAPPPPASSPADAPTDISAQSRTPPGGGFGSGLSNMLPGPHYRAPDPNASPLDQTADTLQQRIQRANSIATNPMLQFFNPEGVAAARNFVPQATEALQKIRGQQAQMQANRQQAATLGLEPGEVPDEASQADRVEVARARALKGDLNAYKGLQAVDPKTAEAIADQVHEVTAGHLTKAQYAFDKLSNMRNQGEYTAAVQSMRKDGTLTDLEALGLKVPPTFDGFNSAKAKEGQALREARIGIDAARQKLEERNTYQPMETKEADTYKGRMTTAYGDQITNGTWSRNAAAGTRGLVVNGAADPRDLGKKYTFATPEQRKEIGEEFKQAVPKEDMEKYRAFNRTYQLATTDAKGKTISADGSTDAKGNKTFLNTNPNVQQGVAEGLASMLRGGQGGANVGLLKIELAKRGWAQGTIDAFVGNYAGAMNTLFADANRTDKPYLSQATQKQIRDVMDVLKTYNDGFVADRATQIAQRAGALGLDAAALGFGKNEATGTVGDAIEAGRKAQIDRMSPQHQAIGGGDGVFQIGAQRPGSGATNAPPGTAPTTQLPGAQPVATPVQQAQGAPVTPPAPTAPPAPPAPGATAAGTPPAGPAPAPTSGPPAGGGPAPSAPAAPPTGGPTPGRFGLPPNMPLNSPQALDAAANRTMQIESGFKPGSATGSYKGLAQWSEAEMKRHGITNPDDPEQNRKALVADIQERSAKLQKDGLPVTAANVYLMHQQGEAGLEAHLRNPDATAWANVRKFYKSDAVAKQAIWGNMTPEMRKQFPEGVNSVKSGDFTRLWAARYDGTDNPQGASVANVENRRKGLSATGRTAPRATEEPAAEGGSLLSRIGRALTSGPQTLSNAGVNPETGLTPEGEKAAVEGAVEHAPAIGSTAGAIVGSAGGPVGTVAGGAVGGGAGQALKDYLQGRPFNGTETAKQTLLGGVLGVAPEGRPIIGALARTGGAGAVAAGAKAAEGGDAEDATGAGLTGAAEAAGGELFGRSLGMVGHKVFSMFAPSAQKAVQTAAKEYHEATRALETESPKLPGVGGAGGGDNPKYKAAEAARDKAETVLKDAGLKPEEAAYAHKVSSEGVPKQEAQAAAPGAAEQERLGKGYEKLREAMGQGVGAPKASPKLPDGPLAAVESGRVIKNDANRELAEHVEMAITAPAANWKDKWTQLTKARSDLLEAERDAMASTAPNKTKTAADMRTLADTVRVQQEKAAQYVFGKADGEKFMNMVKTLDVRYRRVMEATNGGDLAAAARQTGEAGREIDRKFRAFAHDDPTALAAWDAMRATKSNVEKDVRTLVGVEKIPYLGKVVSMAKMAGSFREYMRERAAGSPVKFSDMIQMTDDSGKMVRDVLGSAGSRAAVMQ